MKYSFLQIDYECGFDSKGYNQYLFGIHCEDDSRKVMCDKIREHLLSLFPSLIFESNIFKNKRGFIGAYTSFYITDPADEAAFIVWSGVLTGGFTEEKETDEIHIS